MYDPKVFLIITIYLMTKDNITTQLLSNNTHGKYIQKQGYATSLITQHTYMLKFGNRESRTLNILKRANYSPSNSKNIIYSEPND